MDSMNASTKTYPPPRRETTAGLYSNTLVCMYIYITYQNTYVQCNTYKHLISISLSKLLSKNSVGQLKASRLDLSESSSWTFQIGLKKRAVDLGRMVGLRPQSLIESVVLFYRICLFRIQKKTQVWMFEWCCNERFLILETQKIKYMLLSCLKLITQNHVGQTHRHT